MKEYAPEPDSSRRKAIGDISQVLAEIETELRAPAATAASAQKARG
jgi:hypothetical protein